MNNTDEIKKNAENSSGVNDEELKDVSGGRRHIVSEIPDPLGYTSDHAQVIYACPNPTCPGQSSMPKLCPICRQYTLIRQTRGQVIA